MRYFKVMRGFGNDDFIPIDESELEKAVYAQVSQKNVFFKNGSVNGAHISAIMPDFHRAMGWSYGWKITAEDHGEMARKGVRREYGGFLELPTERVKFLIERGREGEIGSGVRIPEIERIEPLRIESSGKAGLVKITKVGYNEVKKKK